MNNQNENNNLDQRGKAEHDVRDQILIAANEYFSRYGYGKTTVSDLAKEIGFSKAYIYKFFESKQAIGETICSSRLGDIFSSVELAVADGVSATDKLRKLIKTTVSRSLDLFFLERKLYDIAAHSATEKWQSSSLYLERIRELLGEIIIEGRASGEFERKTPIDDTVRAILLAIQPCINPVMLQYNLDDAVEAAGDITNLILRSLAP